MSTSSICFKIMSFWLCYLSAWYCVIFCYFKLMDIHGVGKSTKTCWSSAWIKSWNALKLELCVKFIFHLFRDGLWHIGPHWHRCVSKTLIQSYIFIELITVIYSGSMAPLVLTFIQLHMTDVGNRHFKHRLCLKP